jgi:hypothetical protein
MCPRLSTSEVLACDTVVTPEGGPDLLDANESNWAFVGVDRVDLTENRHVKDFVTLASEDRCRSYCGREDYLPRTQRRQSWRWPGDRRNDSVSSSAR